MIDFTVDPRYVDDLEDDFIMNTEFDLYEFIDGDPVKAFYLGLHINKWFELIDRNQKYLYTKQMRHNKDSIEKYQNQVSYWLKQYRVNNEENYDVVDCSEYVMNNMFWDKDTESIDKVKMAFLFGDLIYNNTKEEDE